MQTPHPSGLICTLSEEGHLELNYLGTSPLLFIPPPTSKTSHAKTIPQLQQKVKELQQQIADVKRSSGNVDMVESNPHTLHCKTLVEHGVIRVELDGLVIPPFVQACLEVSGATSPIIPQCFFLLHQMGKMARRDSCLSPCQPMSMVSARLIICQSQKINDVEVGVEETSIESDGLTRENRNYVLVI